MRNRGSDPATGLLSRLEFDIAARDLIRHAGPEEAISVLLIDIDSVQRRGGRLSREIAQLARVLASELPSDVLVGRVGPDEFAVALQATGPAAKILAEALRLSAAAALADREGSRPITVSIGVASGHGDARIESLMHDAERCLIAAKANGRNRSCTWAELQQQARLLDLPVSLLHLEHETRVELERIADKVAYKTRRMHRHFRELAECNPLTGLNNRGSFDERMKREIDNARKHGTPLSVCILDADDFGNINKNYNVTTGDAALRVLADVLRQTIRSVDWVARYGGEEFCVVMPNTTKEEALQVVERIRVSAAERGIPTHEGDTIRVTVSGGVAELGDRDADQDAFIARASLRLNEAKRAGKNRISA